MRQKIHQGEKISKVPWTSKAAFFLGLVVAALMVVLQPVGAWADDDDYYTKFYGEVQSLPTSGLLGDWLVSGTVVHVTFTTRIEQEHGLVAVGSWVKVKGQWLPDRSFQAYKIEVKRSGTQPPTYGKFYGEVQSLPTSGLLGDWLVSGTVVHVTSTTFIEQEHGLVAVGSWVEIKGQWLPDRSFQAYKIEVKRSGTQPPTYGKFYGEVQSLPTSGLIGDWLVSGTVVHVASTTFIEQQHGLVAVGSWVEVTGQWLSDRSIQAYKIEVKRSGTQPPQRQHLVGSVETLPPSGFVGDWTVAGITVHVFETTKIDQEHGTITVGSWVKVDGSFLADGSFDAYEIEVLSHTGTTSPDFGHRFAVLKLQPTAQAPPEAEGVTLIRSFAVSGSVVREDLKVAVEHLLPGQIYEVFVDGFHAGSIITNAEGEGHLFLSSADIPGAEPLPSELSPVTDRQQVEVRQGLTTIFAGDFANARWDGDEFSQDSFLALAPLVKPDATVAGAAIAKVHEGKQELKLMAFALPGSTAITVVVDGLVLGTVFTSASGNLHVTFSTSPDEDKLLLPTEALPVAAWQQVALQDASGQVLAAGNFVQGTPTVVQAKPRLRIKKGKG